MVHIAFNRFDLRNLLGLLAYRLKDNEYILSNTEMFTFSELFKC